MNLRILRTNLLACTYFYGFWNIANDLFFNTLYVTLFSLVVLTGLVVFLRLPVPSKQIVDGIIGRDPLLDYGESDQIFMKVVAHRGSGLDAPENSLIAFQLVSYLFYITCLNDNYFIFCLSIFLSLLRQLNIKLFKSR